MCITARIAEIAAIPRVLPSNGTGESAPSKAAEQVFWRFSLEATRTVWFQRLHQANAMRSRTDDVAKAP
jgi:hypothetical protein